MHIDTGNSPPRYQPAHLILFVACEEIARQLHQMQQQAIISPSSSLWTSPVVLVCRKGGTLRFCIDSRQLNTVTKAGVFPLPHIDDLLVEVHR